MKEGMETIELKDEHSGFNLEYVGSHWASLHPTHGQKPSFKVTIVDWLG